MPFPRIGTAEPSVAAQKKDIRSLSDQVLLKKKLEILIFENSIADNLFLRNTGNGHFCLKSPEKQNNN